MRAQYFQALFFALLLPFAASASTTNSATMDGYVGTWQPASTSGVVDTTATTGAEPSELKLVLPESMKLSGGRTILLTRIDATSFGATDKSGVVVQFTLKSPGHAYLSIKKHGLGAWSYIGEDLTRQ